MYSIIEHKQQLQSVIAQLSVLEGITYIITQTLAQFRNPSWPPNQANGPE